MKPGLPDFLQAPTLFKTLVERSIDGIVMANESGVLCEWNNAMEKITGYPRDEALGRSWIEVLQSLMPPEHKTPEQLEKMNVAFNGILRSDEQAAGCRRLESELLSLDGRRIILQQIIFPLETPWGYWMGSIHRDVTFVKQAELALRAGETLHRLITENVTDVIWTIDYYTLKLSYLSDSVERLLGFNASELRDQHVSRTMTGESFITLTEMIRRDVTQRAAGDTGRFMRCFELDQRRKDGSTVPTEARLGIIFNEEGRPVEIVGISRDITERKESASALSASMEQLHLLSARLEDIREEERKTISREVHDELGQVLTALKLDLSRLRHSGGSDRVIFEEKIQSMVSLANSAIKTVQDISSKLRPGMLDDLGLLAAVEWQAEDFQKRSGVKCELNLPAGELVLDEGRSTVLFRILQEALTNVARHARAKHVEIGLSATAEEVILSVSDDGVGITDDQRQSPRSIGLLGIRERLHPFQGMCTIERRAQGGTVLLARLPLRTSL